MSLTLDQIQAAIIDGRRCGRWLAAVGMDGSTRTGVNLSLRDPIRRAVRAAGYPVADHFAVADSDLSAVEAGDTDEVLDRANLFTLKLVYASWPEGDDRHSPSLPGATPNTPEARDRALAILKGLIADMQEELDRKYGDSAGTISAGVIGLDFMAGDCGEFG